MHAVTTKHVALVGWALALIIGYMDASRPEPPDHPRAEEVRRVPECEK